MVTYQEWIKADDHTVFENKDNHKRIIKILLKENLRAIEKYMIQQYAAKGEGPTAENVHRIQDLIAATLENFEIIDIKTEKDIDSGIEIPETPHKPLKSRENKGGYCYKCGLQKEDLQIVEKGDSIIKMCKECLMV